MIEKISKFFDIKRNEQQIVEKTIHSPNKKHSINVILDKANNWRSYKISIRNFERKVPYDIVFHKGNNRINSMSWTPDDKSVIIDEKRVIDLESLTEVLNQDNMKISGDGKWILYHDDDIVYLAQCHNQEKSSIVVMGPKHSVKDYAISYDGSLIACPYKDRLIVFTNKDQDNKEELLPAISIQCPNTIWKLGVMSSKGFYLPIADIDKLTLADFRSKKDPVFIHIADCQCNAKMQFAWSQDTNLLWLHWGDEYGRTYEYDLTKLMKFLQWYNQKAGLGQKLLLKAIYSHRILQEKASTNPSPYRLSYSGLIALFKSLPPELSSKLVLEGWVVIDEQNY